MSHECPECFQHCYCDGDDVNVPTNNCIHACAPDTDDRDSDLCLHVSATEQAGGWLVCDDCGADVTREAFA